MSTKSRSRRSSVRARNASRPLASLSNDPFNVNVLSSDLFLVGGSLKDPTDLSIIPESRLLRLQRRLKHPVQYTRIWARCSKVLHLQHSAAGEVETPVQ